MQQPVGKDMAALTLSGKLRLIERHKGKISMHRHGLRRAQQPPGVLGLDPLFPSDQSNAVCPFDRAYSVIDLTREQPQRKSDCA